jgi:predicted dehydrogenase
VGGLVKPLGVGIVGCGLIGQKRAKALGAHGRVVAAADVVRDRAAALAGGGFATADWRDVVGRDDVDVVIVATTNDLLAEIAAAAARAGKHVLVEKPGGRTVAEVDQIIDAQRASGVCVRVGFNHRYHPALLKAKELADSGALGEMMFVRGRYGHGGRVGYDREWRANREIAGGGELIDQGVHLIDLARLFVGDFVDVRGFARTFYWDMAVDDNAFLLLTAAAGRTAFLHVSCTEWKNLFSFEIYGRGGKLHAEGLGGSYGLERLSFYRMLPEMGPPETTIWEFPRGDESWALEFAELAADVAERREPAASLHDARAALHVVETIYKENG